MTEPGYSRMPSMPHSTMFSPSTSSQWRKNLKWGNKVRIMESKNILVEGDSRGSSSPIHGSTQELPKSKPCIQECYALPLPVRLLWCLPSASPSLGRTNQGIAATLHISCPLDPSQLQRMLSNTFMSFLYCANLHPVVEVSRAEWDTWQFWAWCIQDMVRPLAPGHTAGSD